MTKADLVEIVYEKIGGLSKKESQDIVEAIFRQNISMGKGMGLMSMVEAVRTLARRAKDSPSVTGRRRFPT